MAEDINAFCPFLTYSTDLICISCHELPDQDDEVMAFGRDLLKTES